MILKGWGREFLKRVGQGDFKGWGREYLKWVGHGVFLKRVWQGVFLL